MVPAMADLLIYQDYVHNSGNLFEALVSRYGRDRVAYADADAIIKDALTSDVKTLFMPGGATRYVATKLNGAGNKVIDKYVSMGGTYFGICAGAYYACRRTEWAIGTQDEMQIDNELQFFQGIARGPIKDFLNAAERCTAITKVDGHNTLYWEGPEFIADDKASHEVLARYTDLPDQPPAIVTGQYGKGRYILSSPHIEITSERLKLMQFDVVYNRFVELTRIKDISGLTAALFDALLDKYIG
jgi:glutamine amidotransferase-like uncharacterized protein